MFTHDAIRTHLLNAVGYRGEKPIGWAPPLDKLRRQQVLPVFVRAMENRMIMGFLRYEGPNFASGESNGYDNVSEAIRRAERYRQDGNKEHLIDAANILMCEFGCPNQKHPAPHWTSTDDATHARKEG